MLARAINHWRNNFISDIEQYAVHYSDDKLNLALF